MVGLVFSDVLETDQFPFFWLDANRRYMLIETVFFGEYGHAIHPICKW